jgi:hypothetical protein
MATRRVRKILAAGEPRGDVARLKQLVDQVDRTGADAIALVGSLTGEGGGIEGYRAIFKALGPPHLQTFWVPGPADAPVTHYLRESFNIETVYPFLHGVHGTVALGSGYVLFAGWVARSWTTRAPSGTMWGRCGTPAGRSSTA